MSTIRMRPMPDRQIGESDAPDDRRRFARQSALIAKLNAAVAAATADLLAARGQITNRLGVFSVWSVGHHLDPWDVLEQVEPDGDCWRWIGFFNRRGSPCHRIHRDGSTDTVKGAAKLVHRAVVGDEHQKAYQPRCGHQWCVLPSHRCSTCGVVE